MRTIHPGDTFTWNGVTFRREADDPAPVFECERIRVTVLESKNVYGVHPYTFGTESEWFAVRGMVAA